MKLYRSAFGDCVTEEERAWVGYFYAGLLAHQTTDLSGAIRLSEKTHELFHCFDRALQLGNFYVWDHRFEEGAQLIELALKLAPSKPRFERQGTAWLVECFRRWSQAELEAELPSAALEHSLHGVQLGVDLLEATPHDVTDVALMDAVLEAVVAVVAAASEATRIDPEHEGKATSALRYLNGDPRFRDRPSWRYLEREVSSLSVEMRSRLAPSFSAGHVAPEDRSGTRVLGSVVTLGDTFGFIASPDFPTNIYFNAWLLRAPLRMEDLKIGSLVEFAPSRNSRGKDQALEVTLVEGDAEIAKLSAAIVQRALDESPAPIPLEKMAQIVRRAAGSAGVSPWIGRSFKAYLISLEIPGLQISLEGPGYAFIEGIHEPPLPSVNRNAAGDVADIATLTLVVKSALDESPGPIALGELAGMVRRAAGGVEADPWDGTSFGKFLKSLEIPGLKVSPIGPSFAYIEGMHTPPEEVADLADDIASHLHEQIGLPRLSTHQFAAVFKAISDELAIHPTSELTEAGKAIRDALAETSWPPVGRHAIQYVLYRTQVGAKNFHPDDNQDPAVLARAFVEGVRRAAHLDPDSTAFQELSELVLGGLNGSCAE